MSATPTPDMAARLRRIRLLILDVDGVLTDGRLGLGTSGEEIKFFHVHDGLGIVRARKAGVEVCFLTSRRSTAVTRRAEELGVTKVIQGSPDKIRDFEALVTELEIPPEEIAYMGDDLPDLAVMHRVGFSAAPNSAVEAVKQAAHHVTHLRGGEGAVRELIDIILLQKS